MKDINYRSNSNIWGWALAFFLVLGSCIGWVAAQSDQNTDTKARKVVQAAIEAMGGEAYLKTQNASSSGRYFQFRKGRKAFTQFQDWTVYDPVKWRFQLGEGKRQFVQIYNLELGKAWTLEGESTVEEVSEEEIKDFTRGVNRDLDILLKKRLDEDDINLYYYGPDDVAGTGEFEAVEFLDTTNNSVVVFFDIRTHLPVKVETQLVDKVGVKHKEEQEFSNWHEIQGVNVPLRHDRYVDEEISSQRFIEELAFDVPFEKELFLEPVVKED